MTKRKPSDIKNLEKVTDNENFLKRLANPKIQPGIEFSLRRMGELAGLTSIKLELRQSGLTNEQADIALEAARHIAAMDENWIEEITAHIRLGISQTIQQLSEMHNRAEKDSEKRQIMAMKLKCYDGMRKLLPEKIDLNIKETETVEQVIFDTYAVDDE